MGQQMLEQELMMGLHPSIESVAQVLSLARVKLPRANSASAT